MKASKRKKITRNAVRCLNCNDIIESKYTHDFVTCSCGSVSVDGGHDYLRRIGKFNECEELSEEQEIGE